MRGQDGMRGDANSRCTPKRGGKRFDVTRKDERALPPVRRPPTADLLLQGGKLGVGPQTTSLASSCLPEGGVEHEEVDVGTRHRNQHHRKSDLSRSQQRNQLAPDAHVDAGGSSTDEDEVPAHVASFQQAIGQGATSHNLASHTSARTHQWQTLKKSIKEMW